MLSLSSEQTSVPLRDLQGRKRGDFVMEFMDAENWVCTDCGYIGCTTLVTACCICVAICKENWCDFCTNKGDDAQ